MEKHLRVLIVEDSEDDTLLIENELRRGGYHLEYERVETAEAMRRELANQQWELVISDYTLPSFNALAALAVLQQTALDLPFIIVSGSIGEEIAVKAMKAGAHDYIMKNNMARLLPAIERELRDAEIRRERTHTTEALRDSEERYRRIVDTAQEGIVLLDDNATITYTNRRFAEMLGYELSELVGSSLFNYIDNQTPENAALPMEKLMEGAQNHYDLKFLHRDGGELWTILSSSPMLGDDLNVPGLLCMITDITERKRAEQALNAAYDDLEERIEKRTADLQHALDQLSLAFEREKELNELKTRFVSMVSHEFRTPLTSILSSTEILNRYSDKLDSDRQGRLFHVITESVQHMISLLEDVLLFGKGEASRLLFEPQSVHPVALCREIVEEIRSGVRPYRHINFNTLDPIREALIDAKLIRHILSNLLTNALKYSPDGSPVDVSLRCTDNSVIFSVSDYGIGLSKEDVAHLYEPFYRAKNVDTIPGTGLGLAIVKQSVERHGGSIDVNSEPGKGTTFTISIPA
jgi:PAS domain S-box-containing protein